MPQVSLSLLLVVDSLGGIGLGCIESRQVLLNLIIRVGALTRLVANTSDIIRVRLSRLMLTESVLGARLTTVPQTTPIDLLDNNTPLNRGGKTILRGALKPVAHFEFTMVTDQLGSKLRGVLDIDVGVTVAGVGVVSNNNIITFLNIATALLQLGDRLVLVLEAEENLGVGVVANTVSVGVLVVTGDTQTLVFVASQILTDRVSATDVSSLTRRALRHVVVTVLGEVEQTIISPIRLGNSILSNTLNVEHTSQLSVIADIILDLRGGTRDGDDGSSIIRNDSRPLIENRALLQILRREVTARLLVEVLNETAVPDGLIKSLVHALGPVNGGDLDSPPSDISRGSTGFNQLTTVDNKPFSARQSRVLAVGHIVTHEVGSGATSMEGSDIGVRNHRNGGLGALFGPSGSVGVPGGILPVESFNLIDLLV